jgi:hypothetical protein
MNRRKLIIEGFDRPSFKGDLRQGIISGKKAWPQGSPKQTASVIKMCRKHGAPPPTFEERQDFLIVTFKAAIAESVEKISKAPVTAPVKTPVTHLESTLITTQSKDPVKGASQDQVTNGLVSQDFRQVPDKKLQRCRLAKNGAAFLEKITSGGKVSEN